MNGIDSAEEEHFVRAPMNRRVVLGFAAVLIVFAAACSKCGRTPGGTAPAAPKTIVRQLPKDVEAAVVIPDLLAIGEKLKLIQDLKTANFVAQLQGFGSGSELATSFMQAVGVDLRNKEELEKIGVDSSKGAGVALLKENAAYTVVAVKDEAKFKEFLKTFAKNRLGAAIESSWSDAEPKVTTWARSGTTPVLGYVFKDGFAFVAPNTTKERLRAFAALEEAASLAAEPQLDASLKRLPEKRDFIIYAPVTSTLARRGTLAGGTAVGNLSSEALTINVDLPWPNNVEALRVLQSATDETQFDQLPQDAFAVARFSGDPSLMAPFWPHLVGPTISNAFKNAGVDVNAQILSQLKPGISATVSVASTIRFDQRPEFDVRRTNPFRYVHLVALAKPKDAAAAKTLLDKLPEVAPKFGAKMVKELREGSDVLVTSYSQGEGVHLSLVKDTLVAASPVPRMDETVAMVTKGEKGPGPFSDGSFEGFFKNRGAGVLIDLHRLADSIRNLPGDAWGPGGSFVKAGWMRWLDGTDDLRAITVGLAAKDNAVQAEVSLRFLKK